MGEECVYIGNRGGIPVVTIRPLVNASNVVFALPNHIFRFAGTKGIFIVNLTNIIPTDTSSSLPIVMLTNNTTLELNNETGAGLTAGDMASSLTFTVFFDKLNDILRVISPIL